MWKLTIEDDEGQRTQLDLGHEEYTIGRAEDRHIRLTERNVSRRHATLRLSPSGWTVSDEGSYNGTYVNGQRVGDPVNLSAGDVVQLGDYRLELLDASAQQAVAEEGQRQRRPDRLVMVIGPMPGAEFPLTGDRLTMGRAEEAQISVNHASVSRLHAELMNLGQGRWECIDQGSANGIRINGVELRRGIIEPGDALELGDVRLRFVAAGKYFRPRVDLTAQLPMSAASTAQTTQRSMATILAVGAIVFALILGVVVLVGGGSSATDPVEAKPMATTEQEMQQALSNAQELAKTDVFGAHRELARIPETSPLRDADEFRAIEDDWADAMIAKVDSAKTNKEKRDILFEVADTPTVSPEKRQRALDIANAIAPDKDEAPRALPQVPFTPKTAAAPPPKPDPEPEVEASAPPPKPGAPPDTRFDEKAQKRGLYAKAASGRASEDELRMLKAICMNDGDRACRNLAVQRLKEKKSGQ